MAAAAAATTTFRTFIFPSLSESARFKSIYSPSLFLPSSASARSKSIYSSSLFLSSSASARFKSIYSSSLFLPSSFSLFSSSPRFTHHPNLAATQPSQITHPPNVIEILEKRGLVDSLTSDNLRLDCTDPTRPPLRVYCGFDPTAESLHLGNLLGIIVLSWFRRCGHSPVVLIGGATGRIGDPSGKSAERPELDSIVLERNIAGICSTTRKILSRIPAADNNIAILNNYDWWKDVMLDDFLEDVGPYARIGTMMSKESVRKRLESEQGISHTEFTYQLIQGSDFLHLFQNEGINVQIGGSDQWGNITAGTDLISRKLSSDRDRAYGLTFPLLLKSDGTKFGKSEDGAIWLSSSMLSPSKFYQYFFTVSNSDVIRFMKTLTFLSLEEIAEMEIEMGKSNYAVNSIQRRLAEEVTRFVHGEEGLEQAMKATEVMRPGSGTKLDWKTIEQIARDVPSCTLSNEKVMNLSLKELSMTTGMMESKSATRRLLKQGMSIGNAITHSNLSGTQPSQITQRDNVIEILVKRGLLDSLTNDNLRLNCTDPTRPPLRVYCGFDPTAESLHLGNLRGIIVLSWFLRCGHSAVVVIGGATGRIGDPSGKSSERPKLDSITLERNIAGISSTIRRILSSIPTADNNVAILNNYDWWKYVKLFEFLKDVGRDTIWTKESVNKRLESEQGMNYAEFTYQLLQGSDFLHLFQNEGINVQIGGSDQWGNITAGTDLISRKLSSDRDKAYGLTFPLLLKSDGTKFGKSEDGAIWLSSSMLSPYKFYQHFFTVPDSDVIRLMKTLTFLSLEEIAEMEIEMGKSNYAVNSIQRRLAEEVTRFVHGEEGLEQAMKATEVMRPGSGTKLDWKTIEQIAGDVPSYTLSNDKVMNLSLMELSVTTGLMESKSAARRLLKQGGLYLNNCRIDDDGKKIDLEDIVDGKILLLSAGKKNKVLVRVS